MLCLITWQTPAFVSRPNCFGLNASIGLPHPASPLLVPCSPFVRPVIVYSCYIPYFACKSPTNLFSISTFCSSPTPNGNWI